MNGEQRDAFLVSNVYVIYNLYLIVSNNYPLKWII